MAKSKADAPKSIMEDNDTAKNKEKTAKVKSTIPEKTITAYDFMLKEDHDEDFTEAPQVQKHPDPPILTSVESKEDDDEIILSKIKSQTVLQSAQQFEKYRKSLQDEH